MEYNRIKLCVLEGECQWGCPFAFQLIWALINYFTLKSQLIRKSKVTVQVFCTVVCKHSFYISTHIY